MNRFVFLCMLATTVLFFSISGTVRAQSLADWNPEGLIMQRSGLEELLTRLEAVAASSGYSGRVRESARRDAELIRQRLEGGDFRVGDQVQIRVEGEPDIPPEVPVEPGPRIVLPVIGPISLEGVLRSELEDHLTRELGRFIQDPVVDAEARIRVSILGAVGQPGFYTAPAYMLVSEALMLAGGPGQESDMEEMRIERAGNVLIDGDEMRQILAEGRTLDQLNLRAGDQILVPAVEEGSFLQSGWGTVLRWGLGIGTSVLFGVRMFL